MKKGMLECWALKRILSQVFIGTDHYIPSLFQHEMAKGQKKNKWSMSSSIVDVHVTQRVLGWTLKRRPSNIAFVSILSTKAMQRTWFFRYVGVGQSSEWRSITIARFVRGEAQKGWSQPEWQHDNQHNSVIALYSINHSHTITGGYL